MSAREIPAAIRPVVYSARTLVEVIEDRELALPIHIVAAAYVLRDKLAELDKARSL